MTIFLIMLLFIFSSTLHDYFSDYAAAHHLRPYRLQCRPLIQPLVYKYTATGLLASEVQGLVYALSATSCLSYVCAQSEVRAIIEVNLNLMTAIEIVMRRIQWFISILY